MRDWVRHFGWMFNPMRCASVRFGMQICTGVVSFQRISGRPEAWVVTSV